MNILIVKTSAIGDVIHTLPALVSLRNQYPDARIDWLVEEAASGIVLGHWAVNRVLISQRRKWIKDYRLGKRLTAWRGVLSFIKELRSTQYDLLIDFQGLLKSGIFVFLAKAKRKVGFGKGMEHAEGSYLFLNERIPPVNMDIHAIERDLLLLKAIGVVQSNNDNVFPVDTNSRIKAQEFISMAGVDRSKLFIAINPMTTWPTKHWTPHKFAALADALFVNHGATVVFTGGEEDREKIGYICSLTRQGLVINGAGQLDLKTLAALYSCAKLVISTDTGPMHLAAVLTPVVALFGPTAPWRTGPYGDSHHVVRTGIACSPCLKKECRYKTTQCMQDITVEDVMSAVNKILV